MKTAKRGRQVFKREAETIGEYLCGLGDRTPFINNTQISQTLKEFGKSAYIKNKTRILLSLTNTP